MVLIHDRHERQTEGRLGKRLDLSWRFAAQRARLLASALLRSLLYGFGWVVLTENDPAARPYLPVVVALLVAVSLLLHPPAPSLAAWRLAPLLPQLAWESIRGGVDVARRVLDPRLPIEPALVEITVDPPDDYLQIALAYVITAVPGTLVAALTERGLVLHVIDRGRPNVALAAELERRLRRVLGKPEKENE